MKNPYSSVARRFGARVALIAIAQVAAILLFPANASAQRAKGLDTSSAANGSSPSQELWNTAYSQGYEFAILRSSRGGTSDDTRLDDSQFYDNITRAGTAGMITGSYHFARPDAATHTAADDANHYLERAGMYMKPGFLLPVFDLEDGNVELTTSQMTTWATEFIDTIFDAKGIRPIVYTNTSYNNDEVGAGAAWNNIATTPKTDPLTYQWVARPAGGISGLTGNPPPSTSAPGYTNPYGVWDPNFTNRTGGGASISRDPAVKPWVFWQHTLDTTPVGLFKIDIDYANGNLEFVKDFLVPALWTTNGSGEWGTIDNWNSNNPGGGTPTTGPASRLPNALDWVKLQNGDNTVTLSSGAQAVRKFYTEQPLNITGGSLTVNYVPGSGGKWDLPSEFNDAVTLSGGGAYSAHTTQVDGGGGLFNINGGTVTFTEFQLASHATNSGKIVMGGDATFAQTGGAGTSVIRSTGSLAQAGRIELTAGNRTFNVMNGSAAVDLNVRTTVSGTGRLVKNGAGTMHLATANTYEGNTSVSGGVLQIAAADRLGNLTGSIESDHITLGGATLRTGAQISSVALTNSGSGYSSFPTLTVGGAGASSMPASANVLAGISSIQVTAGGNGYAGPANTNNQSSPPTPNGAGTFVDIIGGGGTGATAWATVSGGVVTAINIINAGSGYTSMPTVYISSTGLDINPTSTTQHVAGSGATASINGITLQGIALNDGGFDYTSPTITLSGGGGGGATATATPTPNISLVAARGITVTANGGTLEQTAGTNLTVNSIISSGGGPPGILTKTGPGTLTLTNNNTFSGPTIVANGELALTGSSAGFGTGNVTVQGTNANTRLVISSGVADAIDDAATLSLLGGGVAGVADQGYANLGGGIIESIGALFLNGVQQPGGTYGSSASSAQFKLNEYFAGTGILSVPLEGDHNGDGTVDILDYVVWRANDGNNSAGFNDWASNYGNPPGSGSASTLGSQSQVPEPGTILLTLLAAPWLAFRRRRSS